MKAGRGGGVAWGVGKVKFRKTFASLDLNKLKGDGGFVKALFVQPSLSFCLLNLRLLI